MRTPSKKAPRIDPPKRSLRERAAEVEATAARVLHRPSEVERRAIPRGQADQAPIGILLDRWRDACTAVRRRGLSDAEIERLGDIATAAEEAVIKAPVATVADLACKVEVLRTHIRVSTLDHGLSTAAIEAICDGVDRLIGGLSAEITDPILPAIAAHYAAFFVANSQPTDELSELACKRADQLYKALKATTPTTAGGLCALAAHLRRFLREGGIKIENTFDGEALIVLLDTADRFAAGRGGAGIPSAGVRPSWAMAHAHAVELGGLGLTALSGLFDVYCAARDHWLAVSCQPFCGTGPDAWASPARALAEEVSERVAFIASRIADEVRRRTHDDVHDRDAALSLRVKDELRCEGMILDSDLLIDLVKAWG